MSLLLRCGRSKIVNVCLIILKEVKKIEDKRARKINIIKVSDMNKDVTGKEETKRNTDVQNRLLDSVGEGEGGMFRENSIETCILSRVKQITSPGGMHETSARAWCTGKTQRDWVERAVGGGIRMGNTCKSMADSCQCMAKTTTIL